MKNKRQRFVCILCMLMICSMILSPCYGEESGKKGTKDEGRTVVVAGSFQSILGETNWNPSSQKTQMQYQGDSLYSFTVKAVPKGSYEYKIAMGSWEPENYGFGGVSHGENIKFTVDGPQDVTFWYSDISHVATDSTNYIKREVAINGTGISENTVLKDTMLSGMYSSSIVLSKGVYEDIKVTVEGQAYPYGKIEIFEDKKTVQFSFDAKLKLSYTDLIDVPLDTKKIYYNSRDLKYKSPYGAVPTGTAVTFNLQTGLDATSAKLVLETKEGIEKLDMSKVLETREEVALWTVQYNTEDIEMMKYQFLISNGGETKSYGDDDGYFGPGTVGNIGTVKAYDLNVYDKNFKTPDWMKKGVMYQIFPDRFFNGAAENDKLQKLSRGYVSYEFYNQWYSLPENSGIEFDENHNVKPNYKGTKGDGFFCNEMYGGDLKGIRDKLDYLQSLGVDIIYLNPISHSISNHRYDTTDYKKVDPLLGDMEDFVGLAQEAKARGMHIVLDGVFNHVSDDSVYFDRYGKYVEPGKPLGAYPYWSAVYDAVNTQGLSLAVAEKTITEEFASKGITDLHYKEWFIIENEIVPAKVNEGEHYKYEGWWGYDSMPVIQALGGSEYNVKTWRDEIIEGPESNAEYWLNMGSSGWRLDVANEVSDETWRHFRNTVKKNPDNVIAGEIWTDASKYLMGDMYDTVMNYRFKDAVLGFAGPKKEISATEMMNQLEKLREQYPKEAFEVMMNLVGSHDTERVVTTLDGGATDGYADDVMGKSTDALKMVSLMQMTYPGTPMIYYGDETAMAGGPDPDDRRGMIWGKGDQAMVEWYALLTHIRKNHSVLQSGEVIPLNLDQENAEDVVAFARTLDTEYAVVAINRKEQAIDSLILEVPQIPDGTPLTDVLHPQERYIVDGGKIAIKVPERNGAVLISNYHSVQTDLSGLKDIYDPSYQVPDGKIE